jgi:hypothetical protein
MLPGDGRDLVDTRTLSDGRVVNYWDAQQLAGRWFSERVRRQPGIAWDRYFLYGPEARWDVVPQPLFSSGGTVIGHSRDLQQSLLALSP